MAGIGIPEATTPQALGHNGDFFVLEEKMQSRNSEKVHWGAENNSIVQDEKKQSHKKEGMGKKEREKEKKTKSVLRGVWGIENVQQG